MRKRIPPVPVPEQGTLVVAAPFFGARGFGVEFDGPEARDAAHELPCGHLHLECDGNCGRMDRPAPDWGPAAA